MVGGEGAEVVEVVVVEFLFQRVHVVGGEHDALVAVDAHDLESELLLEVGVHADVVHDLLGVVVGEDEFRGEVLGAPEGGAESRGLEGVAGRMDGVWDGFDGGSRALHDAEQRGVGEFDGESEVDGVEKWRGGVVE